MTAEWTDAQEKRFGEEDCVDEEALKNPIQRERIDVAVKFVGGPGLRVLDVGCSAGGISELIHAVNGNHCWGLDLPAVVARVPEARRVWFKAIGGDLSKKPWFDHKFTDPTGGDFSGFFDVVFAGEIVEHFLDIAPFFEEAHRVLKPDGRLVLTTPNGTRALNRIAMLAGVVRPWSEFDRIPHHCRFWTRDDLSKALVKYGFKPARWGYGRSQAEGGSSIGFQADWLDQFTPSLRAELVRYFARLPPEEIHSFIVVEAVRV